MRQGAHKIRDKSRDVLAANLRSIFCRKLIKGLHPFNPAPFCRKLIKGRHIMADRPRPKQFHYCDICDRSKPVHVTSIKRYRHMYFASLCHRCLWVYAWFHRSTQSNAFTNAKDHIVQGNVITPKIIAIDEAPMDKQCQYAEFLRNTTPTTYLDLLPGDMYMTMLLRYICQEETYTVINTFRLSDTPVSVLNCTSSTPAYTSGTVHIRGRLYCSDHTEVATNAAH